MTPDTHPHDRSRKLALRVLGSYVAVSTLAHLWRIVDGSWSAAFLVVEGLLLLAVFVGGGSIHGAWRRVGDWLPLASLPLLYAGVQWSSFSPGSMHDFAVQEWDRALFGTDPARTLSTFLPWTAVSEVLHLAYLSYYAIIYGPALYLYLQPDQRRGFHHLVLAFTLAMVACFAVFLCYPVEGPRYAWPPAPATAAEPVRKLVLWVLESGSTRGTAFPSSHVAIAAAISIATMRTSFRFGMSLAATTVMLAWGAVHGGFHYATDVLAGALVGIASEALAASWARRREVAAGPTT